MDMKHDNWSFAVINCQFPRTGIEVMHFVHFFIYFLNGYTVPYRPFILRNYFCYMGLLQYQVLYIQKEGSL